MTIVEMAGRLYRWRGRNDNVSEWDMCTRRTRKIYILLRIVIISKEEYNQFSTLGGKKVKNFWPDFNALLSFTQSEVNIYIYIYMF